MPEVNRSDVAIHNPDAEPLRSVALVPATDTVRSLAEWAVELDAATRMADALCRTSFVPDAFRGKPEETAAAILTGASMGMAPPAALRAFHVIKGRVGMYSKAKVALLRAHGHSVFTVDRTDDAVTVAGRRKGSTNVEEITITMAQAQQAGWTTNEAYKKTPQDMLWARAASRVCDLVAPELIHGIASVEEADDLPPIQATATVGAPVTVDQLDEPGANRLPRNFPAPEEPATPPAERAAETPAAPRTRTGTSTSGGMTPGQQGSLHAAFREIGITDRAIRVGLTNTIVNPAGERATPVTSAKELTRAEANLVIDTLGRAKTNPEPLQYLEQLYDLPAGSLGGPEAS